MTLETETFETETFVAGAALRATGFGAAFLALLIGFGLAAFLGTALTGFLASGREGDLAALALFAFGLAVAAFVTRFAVLAGARFVFERDAGRRTPFARLLLMGLNLKRLLTLRKQPRNRRELTTGVVLNQWRQSFAGALRPSFTPDSAIGNNKEKC